MSVVMSAVAALHTAVTHQAIAFATAAGEEFNPDKVTPGPEGFIATAVFAAAVILLGFLLVNRLRRNGYRHEIRDEIAAEIAATDGAGAAPAAQADGDQASGESRPAGA